MAAAAVAAAAMVAVAVAAAAPAASSNCTSASYAHRVDDPDKFNWCSVPRSAPDAFLFAALAVLVACCLHWSSLSAVLVLLAGALAEAAVFPINLGRWVQPPRPAPPGDTSQVLPRPRHGRERSLTLPLPPVWPRPPLWPPPPPTSPPGSATLSHCGWA